jgi:hypothetical protein
MDGAPTGRRSAPVFLNNNQIIKSSNHQIDMENSKVKATQNRSISAGRF